MQTNRGPWPFGELQEKIAEFEAREAKLRKLWGRVMAMAAEIEQEYNNHNFEAVQWWRTNIPDLDCVKRKTDDDTEVCMAPHYHMLRTTEQSAMPETIVFKKEKSE